jgi:hypothetical protein
MAWQPIQRNFSASPQLQRQGGDPVTPQESPGTSHVSTDADSAARLHP